MSVYIDTYHAVLCVFSTSTAWLAVDGYFTSYPGGHKILLRQAAKRQPAMILFRYGKGQVLAATLFTDYVFVRGYANQSETGGPRSSSAPVRTRGNLAR